MTTRKPLETTIQELKSELQTITDLSEVFAARQSLGKKILKAEVDREIDLLFELWDAIDDRIELLTNNLNH